MSTPPAALTSARSKRKGDGEELMTQTNLEAAAEIARQLVLRDVGGLIVVDFIDMSGMKNRRAVEKAMRDAMRGDRARHDVTRLSKLGLLEIARQPLALQPRGKMARTLHLAAQTGRQLCLLRQSRGKR